MHMYVSAKATVLSVEAHKPGLYIASAGSLPLNPHDRRSRLQVTQIWQSGAQSYVLAGYHGYRPHRNTADLCLDEPESTMHR